MSFRLKMLLSMMLVVGAITTATLLGTQRTVQRAYEEIFEQQFQNQISYFTQLQEVRLAQIRDDSLALAKSVRLLAALDEMQKEGPEGIKVLNDMVRDELFIKPGSRARMRMMGPGGGGPPGGPQGGGGPGGPGAGGPGGGMWYRLLDAKGTPLLVDNGPRTRGRRDIDVQLKELSKVIEAPDQQQVGYLAGATEGTNAHLHEVVLTKIIDPADDKLVAVVVLGVPVSESGDRTLSKMSQIESGIYLEGEIHSRFIPESVRGILADRLTQEISKSGATTGRFSFNVGDRPHTVFYRNMNPASAFPPAYQVCLYSLDEPVRVQRDLRAKILLFGGLAMLAALAVSLALSHGLSGPIDELVRGTRDVAKGDFDVRVKIHSKDEIGQLAESFNQMTEGLALKERYRSVLDMVADKRIADDLIHGKIALGGEEREVSVLFCDIRGFTALTQNMEPPEVIQMLNEHFTPLTKLVYEHHGVVDKFVGDLIMAIFGAPTSHGNDPLLAAQCALRMLEERAKDNETSKYKIAMGIGIASGKAVAGRMGSANRLNYTVIGPRVNLASRLCGYAGRMEVVIDENTFAVCKDLAEVEPLPELKLKGFSEPVHAYKLKSLKPQ